MIRLPEWVLHVGIALNSALFVGFWVSEVYKMALISFLSACAFWVNLAIKDRKNNNE
jgi:hypothetical protein